MSHGIASLAGWAHARDTGEGEDEGRRERSSGESLEEIREELAKRYSEPAGDSPKSPPDSLEGRNGDEDIEERLPEKSPEAGRSDDIESFMAEANSRYPGGEDGPPEQVQRQECAEGQGPYNSGTQPNPSEQRPTDPQPKVLQDSASGEASDSPSPEEKPGANPSLEPKNESKLSVQEQSEDTLKADPPGDRGPVDEAQVPSDKSLERSGNPEQPQETKLGDERRDASPAEPQETKERLESVESRQEDGEQAQAGAEAPATTKEDAIDSAANDVRKDKHEGPSEDSLRQAEQAKEVAGPETESSKAVSGVEQVPAENAVRSELEKPQTSGTSGPSDEVSAIPTEAQKEAVERYGLVKDSSADYQRLTEALEYSQKVDREPEGHWRENSASSCIAVQPERQDGRGQSDKSEPGRQEAKAQSSADELNGSPDQKEEVSRPQEQQRTESDKPRPIASFESNAVKQADGMTRFEVRKESFEWKTGASIEREKVYAVDGEIEGIGTFRKIQDGNTEGSRMAFFAPKEASDSIASGEKHTVHVYSVKEISANRENRGEFYVTPYNVAKEGVRFDIPAATFEKRTRAGMKEGITYDIQGKIGEREFKATHTASRENEHVVVTMYGERAKGIEVGKEKTVVITSVEEKRTLPVTGAEHPRLTVQKRQLESHGVPVDVMQKERPENRIVELKVRNLSSDDQSVKTIYGQIQPSEGTLPLSIGNIGGKRGDKFELIEARKHDVKDFVEKFEKYKGESLQNVKLSLEKEKLYMEVDGQKFQAKSYQLEANRLLTFLSVEVPPYERDIRFWSDGERVTAKYGQSWRIHSFEATEHGLSFTYSPGDRTVTTRLGHELPTDMSVKEIEERVGVETGRRLGGTHAIQVDQVLATHIQDRITAIKGMESTRYFFERGGLGEDIGIAAVSKMTGWDLVERHPFDENGPGRDPFKVGTDALFRNPKTGELFLVEYRWWGDYTSATKKALAQVESRRRDEIIHRKYGRISGAYVASLHLDVRSNRGELHVRRAW